MKYYCKCGHELRKTDMGMSHNYYRCDKFRGGCDKMYGILGERYYWNVPAIDEFTGEIIYEVTFTADGSYRTPPPTEHTFCKEGFTEKNVNDCVKYLEYKSIGKGCDQCYWFIESP